MTTLFCGVDFHKNSSTFVVLNPDGKQIGTTKRVQTDRLLLELSNLKNLVVGIESSGGVNHVADRLIDSGIDVRIINSNKARAIGYGGKKTDAKDAHMIAELLRTNFAPEVTRRSKFARDMSLLITAREQIVKQRTAMICHIRGLLREYGFVMPTGADSFYKRASLCITHLRKQNPSLADVLSFDLEKVYEYKAQESRIEKQIAETSSHDPRIVNLHTIPGVGLLGAYLMMAVVDDVTRFANSKSFASYLGLVPREYSSGDSRRLGSVTKAGNETLRRYLIHGARAVLSSKRHQNDHNYRWAKRLEAKKGTNKATMALAHKMSRIAFAMLRDDVE